MAVLVVAGAVAGAVGVGAAWMVGASGDEPETRQEVVAERGAAVMPFDLDATTHSFDVTDLGGVQTVVADDPGARAQVDLIRQHLRGEVARFRAGDFGDPAEIHGHDMPGLAVLEANAAACTLLQLDRRELIGLKLSTLIDAPSIEHFARHMRSTLNASAPQRCELSLALSDGKRCDVRIESVRNHLNPQQCRTALVDVSPVRQLQRQLERSQRLEAIGTRFRR